MIKKKADKTPEKPKFRLNNIFKKRFHIFPRDVEIKPKYEKGQLIWFMNEKPQKAWIEKTRIEYGYIPIVSSLCGSYSVEYEIKIYQAGTFWLNENDINRGRYFNTKEKLFESMK